MNAEITTVKVKIRKAMVEDFYNGYPKSDPRHLKHYGLRYFLRNHAGELEAYAFSQLTDTKQLLDFIAAGRCYVIATGFDSEVEPVE